MNSLTRRTKIKLGAALVLGLLAWLWWRDAQPSHKDIQTMQTYTQDMQTHCVGRFLIDAPKGVDTGEGSYETQIASVKVDKKTRQPMPDVLLRLDRELAARVAAQAVWKDYMGRPIGPAQAYSPQANVRSIWYGKPDSDDEGSFQMDGYVVRPGGTFVFNTNATTTERIKEFHDFLIDIEPKLSVRDDATIPTTQGFCINGGLIATNPKRGENVNYWGWDLPGHPDVSFSLDMRTNGNEVDEGIVDREASTLREAGAAVMKHVHTLRKRRFDLAGMPAQEWSVEITDDEPQFNFQIEIPGAPNDNAKPFIGLQMRVGKSGTKDGYRKPSLSKGEALALWDAVIQSLRRRPGAL